MDDQLKPDDEMLLILATELGYLSIFPMEAASDQKPEPAPATLQKVATLT